MHKGNSKSSDMHKLYHAVKKYKISNIIYKCVSLPGITQEPDFFSGVKFY